MSDNPIMNIGDLAESTKLGYMNQRSHVVYTIYFKPADVPAEAPEEKIKTFMKESQEFYRKEMERHEFDAKTFRLDTKNGDVDVRTAEGKEKACKYTCYQDVESDLVSQFPEFEDKNNIYVIFMGGTEFVKPNSNNIGVGFPFDGSKCGGAARIATVGKGMHPSIVAHELGHAFGLYHNIKHGNFLMNSEVLTGHGREELNNKKLDKYEAEWLDRHRHFNDIQATSDEVKISIKDRKDQPNTITFLFDVESRCELHQVQILKMNKKPYITDILNWRPLKSKHNTVKIRICKSELETTDEIRVLSIDTQGNTGQKPLWAKDQI